MRNLLQLRHWAFWLAVLAWAGPLSSRAQQTIGANLVPNGNFSFRPAGAVAAGADMGDGTAANSWTSDRPYGGNFLYPAEGSLSDQQTSVSYDGGNVVQRTFPGDPANAVAPSNTYLLYNGNTTGTPDVWRKDVTVVNGAAYRFVFYASNATSPSVSGRALPTLRVGVSTTAGAFLGNISGNITIAEEAVASGGSGQDVWTRYVVNLSGATTSLIVANSATTFTINLYDNSGATTAAGGDVAITGISFQRVNQVPRGQQTAPTVFGRQGIVALPTLRADDPDTDLGGSVVSYQITALPPVAQGILYLNGSPVRVNQVLTTTEAASLSFDPNTGFSGNALFTYTATDNLGDESLPLNYGIPINNSTCNTQSIFKFSDRPLNESWTTPQTATVDGVTITSSNYATSAGAVTFQISDQTGIDPGNAQPGKGLTWTADYNTNSSNAALTNRNSTVKFAFTDATLGTARLLQNFTMVVGDIDRAVAVGGDPNNGGNGGFIDRLIFNGTDANGNTVTLTGADVATAPNVNTFTGTSSYIGPVAANSVTGIGQSGSPAGNIVLSFPVPVKDVTVTYTNLDPIANPANQAVTFLYLSWCGEADLNTIISGPLTAAAGQTVYYYATTTNTGPRPATNAITTITLPGKPDASTVNVPNGSYNQATGVVTFNTIPSLAVNAQSVNYVSFVMPAGATSFTGSAASSALEVDNTPANNNGTATAANITTTVGPTGATGAALACPPNTSLGKDGTVTTATAPNTYYLPSASAAANQKNIGLSATYLTGTNTSTGGTGLIAGDLVMIVQMQGGTLNVTNTDSYGDGVAGPSANGTVNRVAGLYEYGVVVSAPAIGAAGTLVLRDNLTNSYTQADATTGAGQQTYQVIRIPQYTALTVSGQMSPPAWNGRLGGVLALDVVGPIAFNTNGSLDATGKGFRGGAGRQLQGATGVANTDYRTSAGLNVNGTKGEGTAGTPRYVNANGTYVDTRTATTGYPTILPAGLTDGYPSGDNGRGAPGTAGGGGTDGETGANQWNSGGAGGANGGRGGRGGNSFNNNLPVGGEPGAAFPNASSSRLVLGGGGGAGTTNDGTGTPGTGSTGAANPGGFSSSGAAGGGMILLRVGFVQGAGTIVANGANANNTTQQDGGGGGGAGGSILVTANGTTTLGGLTLTANGGTGGNSNPASVNASGHGPGGGGGAGIVVANAPVASATAQPGSNGLSTANNGVVAFGAEPGTVGIVNVGISNSVAASGADASCVSDLTTTITGPLTAASGSTVNLTVSFGNQGALTGQNVTRTVTLPNTATGVTAPGGTISGGGLNPYVITYPTLTTLVPGASNTYAISYTAGLTTTTATSNIGPTGTTGAVPDIYVANNTSSVTTTVVTQADVTTSITGPALVAPGTATGSFTATFTNNGPSTAANVTRTVTLPAGATITTAQLTALQGTYGAGTAYSGGTGGVLTFPALTTLNAGATSTVVFPITASATPGAATIQSNVGTTTPEGTNPRPNQAQFAFTVAPLADVVATITNNGTGTVTAGGTGTFVATFGNNGPSTAANVVPTVQLPAGLSGVAATNGGTYNAATGVVTYPAIASQAPGSANNFVSTITFTMPGVPVAAAASVNTDSNEGTLTANNTAQAVINSASTFDVTTRLTGPGTAAPGTAVTFDVLTVNNGPGVAPSTTQTVTIPGVFTSLFVSNGGTYSNNGTNTTVTFPAITGLASGANVSNTITLTMPATAINNVTATVAATGDSNTGNNSATASVTTSTAGTGLTNLYTTISPALKITPATTLITPVVTGTDVQFNVTIGNYGPVAATNAVTRVALPAGLSDVVVNGGGSYNTTTGVVTFPAVGTLAQGSTVVYTITLPAPLAAGPLVAVSSVASDMAETVPDDNVATTKIELTPLVDVATTLVGPTGPTTGQTATYVVTTANNGPTPAYGVSQRVLLPLGLSDVAVRDASNNPVTLPTGAYNPATGVLTLPAAAVPATLAAGASTVSYVSFTTPNSTSYPVTAAVSTSSQETNVNNNSATVTSVTNPATDVSVTLTGPASVPQGNPVTYTVTTVNNGSVIDPTSSINPSSTTTVQLPMGLSNVVVSGGGSYNSGTGVVTFPPITFQALGAAGAVSNTITFAAPSVNTTPIVATAQVAVSPSGSDPILTNNVATVVTDITNASSANPTDEATTISATVGGTAAGPGNPAIAGTGGTGNSVVFTVNSINNGPNPASNVVQRVQLPANLNVADVVLSNGSYDPTTGIVTFNTLTTQNVLTNTYTITLNNIPGGLSNIVATAYVSTNAINGVGGNNDTNPNNNTFTVTVPVSPRADLVTTVSGPTSVNPGSPATYLVTTRNIGPSTASSVATTAQLPTNLAGVVVSGGGSYDPNSGVVTFPTVTYLPGYSGSTAANTAVPQVSYTITLTAPSTITLAAGYTVTATSTTATTEITTVNNTSSVTTVGANQPPTALSVVNQLQTPQGNTAGALFISPLVGTDPDGTIASYQLTSIPPIAQGVLFYNSATDGTSGTAVPITAGNFAALNLTPAQVLTLKFDPGATYSGNVFFTYTTTDNLGAVSAPALYTIPVNNDVPAVYTTTPVKSSTTFPYSNGDVLANVTDANGAVYNTSAVQTDNGVRNAVVTLSSTLPPGTALNPANGQITVSDRTQLVPGSYTFNITTIDAYGGVTNNPVTLVIGGSPIAVDDFATTPLNTAIVFAVAGNDLANFGAAINPATIDLDPNTAGIQSTFTTAQGTFLTNAADATIPVGSVRFTPVNGFTGTATTSYTINNSATPPGTSNQANLIVTVRGNLPVDLSTNIRVSGATSGTVNAGANVTLNNITATNNGTTTAANVVQTVVIPTGLTPTIGGIAPGTPSGGVITYGTTATYNQNTGVVAYTSTSIGVGITQTYGDIVFPAPVASFVATAQVGNGTVDPTPANNVATVPVTVTPQFDLITTLSGPTSTTGVALSAVSGDLYALTVTSRNGGPNTASNALQTVTIGSGRTGVFVTGGGYYNSSASGATVYLANGTFTTTNPGGGAPSYSVATGQVIFPPLVLASGQGVSNTISFAPTANFTAQADITPNTTGGGDTNTGNNSASLAVTPAAAGAGTANAYVTLTGPATATPGAAVSYQLTQGNRGPAAASGVTTTVSLPTGLVGGLGAANLTLTGATSVTATASGYTFNGGAYNGATYNSTTGILTLPTLTTQASAATPQSATIGLPAPANGTYNVTATVATTNTDPVPGDNVASVMTNVTPTTDISVSLTGPATATAGQPLTYTVAVGNSAGQPAANVATLVTLPAGLTASDLRVGGQTGTLGGTTISFTNGASYNTLTGVLTLGAIGTLPAGVTQNTAVTFTAPGSTAGALSLTAIVSTTTPETVVTNNRSNVATTVASNSDVVVAIAGPTSVTVGNPVTYTVTTTNNGPSVAGTVNPTVQLPTGLTNVVVRDNNGAIVTGTPYNAATGVVTFPVISNLMPGTASAQTGTITFDTPSTTRLDVAAVAAVPAANGDPNLDNNRAALTATTVTLAGTTTVDVAVTLTSNAPLVGGVPTVTAGTPVVYTLTTQNNTAAVTANSVSRIVSLATGLTTTTLTLNGTTSTSVNGNVITFNGGPNDGATYNASTGVLTLPAVASLVNGSPVTTTITVTPTNGPLTASATVAATNTESNTANNFAQATTVTVTPSADVATYLSAPASAPSGSTVAYTVTTANNGPSNVGSVVQTVNLPSGVTSYSLNGGATVSGNVVSITVSNLPSGSSQTNVITFTMPNTASVTGTASVPTTNDPNTANNNATATTTLPNQAPVARDVVNALQNPQGNTAGQLAISPLAGSDADGTVQTYQVTSLPTTTQGVLYYNNNTDGTSGTYVALPVGQNLTPAQAGTLRFDPASTFAGSVYFGYTATDNLNAVSQPARYTIQSGIDNNSVYAATPTKGNANAYQNDDVLAFVVDPNGASYNSSGLVYSNTGGTRSTILQSGAVNGVASSVRPTGANSGPATASGNYPANPNNDLPAGTAFDPATGLIYVVDRTLLPRAANPSYYQINVITTDLYGGVNTVVAQFIIGANPLPVTLVNFTAQAVQNRDGLLKWTTASEVNNDHFEVERSLDGRSFVKIGQRQGQGSKASATDYDFTDADVASKVAAGQPVYYRLKQVDADGTSTYSPVRTVSFTEAAGLITLFPNPAAAATSLDLRSLPLGNTYQATLLDAAGREVRQLTLGGGQVQELNLSDVASGTYQVLVSGQHANGSALKQVLRLIKE